MLIATDGSCGLYRTRFVFCFFVVVFCDASSEQVHQGFMGGRGGGGGGGGFLIILYSLIITSIGK